ncbi:MAG: hypothetical protein AABZ61_14575, partial [Bacteroidota bacterium]
FVVSLAMPRGVVCSISGERSRSSHRLPWTFTARIIEYGTKFSKANCFLLIHIHELDYQSLFNSIINSIIYSITNSIIYSLTTKNTTVYTDIYTDIYTDTYPDRTLT